MAEPNGVSVAETMHKTFDIQWTAPAVVAVYQCRRCPKAWDVDCDPVDGTVDKGSYNSLYAHARSHEPGGVKMRPRVRP